MPTVFYAISKRIWYQRKYLRSNEKGRLHHPVLDSCWLGQFIGFASWKTCLVLQSRGLIWDDQQWCSSPCNLKHSESKAGRLRSSGSSSATCWVLGQPGLHDTLTQKQRKNITFVIFSHWLRPSRVHYDFLSCHIISAYLAQCWGLSSECHWINFQMHSLAF